MGFLSLFRSEEKRRQHDIEKWELERQFLADKHEAKLEYEKRRKDLEFITLQKRADLENLKLDYEIREAQAQIAEDFDGSDDDDETPQEDKLLSNIFSQIMASKQQPPQQIINDFNPGMTEPNTSNPPGAALDLSDQDINNILDGIDQKYLKMAQKMPDGMIKAYIKKQYPQVDDKTLIRAIIILRSRK